MVSSIVRSKWGARSECVSVVNHLYMTCLSDVCMFIMQRIWIQDSEGAEDKGGDWSISQGKRCLEGEGNGTNTRGEQVTVSIV